MEPGAVGGVADMAERVIPPVRLRPEPIDPDAKMVLAQHDGLKFVEDVGELRGVGAPSPRTKIASLEPSLGECAEPFSPTRRVDVATRQQIGLHRRQPCSCVGLGGEGRVSGNLLPEVAVARLIAPRRELPDVAEGPAARHSCLLFAVVRGAL